MYVIRGQKVTDFGLRSKFADHVFFSSFIGHVHKSDLEIVGKCVGENFQPFKGTPVQPS